MKAIILDDEKEAAEALKLKIETVNDSVQIIHLLNDSVASVDIINKAHFDVLFLDIDMPGLNGFEMLEQIPNKNFVIVFVTAYNEYSIKAIKANAFDYLLKPVDSEELMETITRLKANGKTGQSNIEQRIDDLKLMVSQMNGGADKIMLNSQNEILFVDLIDVIRVEANGNYCIFHLKNGVNHLVTKTIGEYEGQLQASGFFRIHKTHLVNMSHIKRFDKVDMLVEMNDGSQIELASRRKIEFIDLVQKKYKF